MSDDTSRMPKDVECLDNNLSEKVIHFSEEPDSRPRLRSDNPGETQHMETVTPVPLSGGSDMDRFGRAIGEAIANSTRVDSHFSSHHTKPTSHDHG